MRHDIMMGIYKITNKLNGNSYIGQSVDIPKRWKQEIIASKNRNDKAYHYRLSTAFRKYGVENFTFEVLELIQDKTTLTEREIHYYNIYQPEYNFSFPVGGNGFSSIARPIIQLTYNGDFIAEYESGMEAERITKIPQPQIHLTCNYKRTQAGGYFWAYKDEYEAGYWEMPKVIKEHKRKR